LATFVEREADILALVFVWLRELVLSRDGRYAEAVRAVISPDASEPREVRVWIEGPAFVDPTKWNAPGELVSALRARWLLAELDGFCVGGGRLSVRTEPSIRKGRRRPRREDRGERRRRTFSRWDRGIQYDEEGLISATPEALARTMANGARGVVLDGTAGIGCLTIAYALESNVSKVIAVDRDPRRLAMARHNAEIYGVSERIEFVCGDTVEMLDRFDADVLLLDPPWGGREYDRERVTLEDLSIDVRSAIARFEGNEIVLKLPRSFDPSTLPGSDWRIEPVIDERGILKFLVARLKRDTRAESR
jgi:trimethylguanosine synthase